ncbi:ABC transporter substrate-binding protein [Paramaledivibacter caminithermalis]|uniref:Iron complex transport system substrate-binding protein n=1 Tax=Paramaledivibacter caminithermalis (strain DSM 15212 / CIP 107654 / DViRD3) TaxID=1121301 RepID=A0A1M6P2H0_PARC5|nr:ABC transporter substrate-binding protein [Paramaledivibacter caminithermalis]SHK02126.1 iron complex transport system substrate-binding protein [Paramaledivibacter caminithermalis DSM 15212]
MKRLITIVLMGMIAISVVGCKAEIKGQEDIKTNVSQSKKETQGNSEVTFKEEDNEKETKQKVIIDQNGRKVELPDKIERIVTGRILPFPAVWFLATGSTDEIVGIHPASKSAAENSILKKMAPSILEAKTNFIKGSEMNIEELYKLKPDIVFMYGDSGNKLDEIEGKGINAVGIKTMSIANGDSVETLNSWLELLGQMTNQEKRAGEIIDYGRRVQQGIDKKLEGVEKAKKKKGLMIFTYADKGIVVSGKGFFGNHWLKDTGAVDVAENDINIKGVVNMEQIYKWNPEIIYITNFTDVQPEDLYNNTIEGQDWSKVKAVQDRQVYKIPLGIYRWFPPCGDSPLMLKWLAQKNYPEIFNDYKIEDEIKKYYKKFYDYELTDDEVNKILNPSRSAAEGYN